MRRLGRGVDDRPMQTVERGVMRESSTQIMRASPDGRTQRWWDLTLACGHVQEVRVRYAPSTERGKPRQRSHADAKPHPRRSRCDTCGSNAKLGRSD